MRKFRLSESKAMLASALQSGRNFDRRSKTKLLSMLALLLMAVTQGAWAQEELSESFTTNLRQTTYTGEHIKITCTSEGDNDGFRLNELIYDATATITALNDHEKITKVEFTRGWYDINSLRSDVGTTTFSGNVGTVSDVYASSLTVYASAVVQIKAVKVYYAEWTAATDVSLSQTEATLPVGNTLTLIPTVSPANATNKSVKWTTSDATVATVDANGKVTAVGVGTATITATDTNSSDDTSDDLTATCEVQVLNVDVTSVTLSRNETTLFTGKTVTLTPTVLPANATNKTVTWTTSDATVATVANGVVTGHKFGTATITVTATNGTDDTSDDVTATCEVTVTSALSTDASGAYLINNKNDWDTFASEVNGGNTYSGKTVKLAADVSGITTRTGDNNAFSGTLDGQDHVLNLNINVATDAQTAAPFGWIKGATIKDLHITGSVTTAGRRFASIAGYSESSTITNCWSEVALTSSRADWVDGGAIVGRIETSSTVTLNGCLFTGSITYSNAKGYQGGGMIGWRHGTAVLNNCVFAPSEVNITKYNDEMKMFVGNGGGTLTNCYYNDVAAATDMTVQGKQMRSITAGDDVTISGLGDATDTYDVSGITAYSKGVKYGDVCYAANGEAVTLTLAPAVPYFIISECSVTGGGTLANATTSTPTLTMTDADQTITVTGSYRISSKSHWDAFCTAVNAGTTYEGETIYLDADISGISTRTDAYKAFSGTFDGQGHTMELNINVATADATSAPFGWIKDATIKNLHITGSETTAGLRIASIAGYAQNCTITNCWSEVALTSSHNSYIDGGAFVARVEDNATLTLNGCVFTGSITYSNAAGCEGGGMVGWTRPGAAATLNNCVFAPSSITITKYSDHYMFVGGKTRGTLNNCYYNAVAAASSLTKEGKQMRSITAGDDVTALAISGAGTEYNVSGITAYATGIKYNNVFYAGNSDAVSLTLSHGDKPGYTFNQYTATGGGTLGAQTETSASLTMTDADQTISVSWTKNELTLSETADNATTISEAAGSGKTYAVTLTRTLQQGGWNTFCVPFDLATPAGWTVKELTASSFNSGTGELTLTFADAAGIEAGKPYLVKVSANVANPTFEGVTISDGTITTETTSADFVPVMNPTSLSGGDKTVLFVTGGNKLTYPTADGDINGLRAYFLLKGDAASLARAFRMSFDDDATGIRSLTPNPSPNGEGSSYWYTLDGKRLSTKPTAKGVYIVNGKKIVVK